MKRSHRFCSTKNIFQRVNLGLVFTLFCYLPYVILCEWLRCFNKQTLFFTTFTVVRLLFRLYTIAQKRQQAVLHRWRVLALCRPALCFRKPRREWQRELHQINDLMSKTTCVINLCTFLCRPLQNNKDQILRCLWNANDSGWFFVLPFGIESSQCILSLSKVLEPLAYWTYLENCEFRW